MTLDLEGNVEYFYSDFYKKIIREGKVGFVQNLSHKYLERSLKNEKNLRNILEVGVGSGDHLQFVTHTFDQYFQSDIRIAFLEEIEKKENLQSIVLDATSIPLAESSVDRVISTCLLLHLKDPEKALSEWRRVVRDKGVVSILIPCEPGFLLRLARSLSTNLKAKKLGYINYKLFNARDHINHLPGLKELIKHVFNEDNIKVYKFPFPMMSWNFNLFFVYKIKISK